MREHRRWFFEEKGMWIVAVLILFVIQGALGATTSATANSGKLTVLDPFSLKVVTVQSPSSTGTKSILNQVSPVAGIARVSVLSTSLNALRIVDPGNPSKTLVFRNNAIIIPALADIKSPSQLPE